MGFMASSLASLSRIIDDFDEAAVILDEFGEVVLYNHAAEALAGARIERDMVPFRSAVRGRSIVETKVLLAIPDRDAETELTATMHPIRNPMDRTIAVLGVFQPTSRRARDTLQRAADVFMAAAAFEPETSVLVFDNQGRVVVSTSDRELPRLSLCDRALRGEVCRVSRCADCTTEMRSGPIRDSLGFIVGGLLVAYGEAAA